MHLIRYLLVFAATLCAVTFGTAHAQTLTLPQAIAKTLSHNPQLRGFEFKQKALTAQRKQAQLKPQFTLALEAENFAGSGEIAGTDSAEVTLALSSTIELGSKQSARIAVVDAQQQLALAQQQIETLDVLGNLSRDFINALALQEQVSLANYSVQLAQTTLTSVTKRAELGAAPEADVLRAKAALSQTKLHAQTLQTELTIRFTQLAKYWGEPAASFNRVQGELYTFAPAQTWQNLLANIEQGPAIAQLTSEQRIAKAQYQLISSQASSDIEWQLGVRSFASTGDTGLVAAVSMPLGSSKRNRHAMNAQQAKQDELIYQQQHQKLQLQEVLFKAYHLRNNAINAANTLQQNILPNLQQALALTQQAYESGRYSYRNWLAAQQDLLEANHQLIQTAADAHNQQTMIEQLTGQALPKH